MVASSFQLHKGTIKTGRTTSTASGRPNFNSIKVRLKRNVANAASAPQSSFQFHKGTIKTDRELSLFGREYLISIP